MKILELIHEIVQVRTVLWTDKVNRVVLSPDLFARLAEEVEPMLKKHPQEGKKMLENGMTVFGYKICMETQMPDAYGNIVTYIRIE